MLNVKEKMMVEPRFIEMKASEIRLLKEKIWISNGRKCPVLDQPIHLEKMTRNKQEF